MEPPPKIPIDEHAVLTLSEAAEELRCSKAHLSHIAHGRVHGLPPLPVVRIGRRVVIRKEALSEWVRAVEKKIA